MKTRLGRLAGALIACAVIGSMLMPTAEAALPVMKATDAARLSQVMPRSIHSSEATYFLLTDRYANGDPTND